MVKNILKPKQIRMEIPPVDKAVYDQIQDRLKEVMGTKVSINPKKNGKGKIEVLGPLQSGSYIDRETGKKIYTKTVFVEELNFAETKAEEEARRQAEGQPEPQPAPDNSFMDIPEGVDSELPFN